MSNSEYESFEHRGFASVRGVGHRITVALVTLSLLAVVWLDKASPLHALAAAEGRIGFPFTAVLASMSVVALLDAVFNDICGFRRSAEWAAKGRLYFYMLQSAMNIGIAFTGLGTKAWSWSLLLFLVIAFSCMWIAVMDTYHRYIEPRTRPGSLL